MNIAVFVDFDVQSGGFQQAATTVLLLKKFGVKENYSFVFFSRDRKTIQALRGLGVEVEYIKLSFVDRAHLFLRRDLLFYKFLKILKNPLEELLSKFKIGLVYFTEPNPLSLYLENTNYITTVWDLRHRDFVEFPEVYVKREFERKEYFFSNSLKEAVAVITNSKSLKEKIIKRYGVDEDRIKVAPFIPTFQINLHNIHRSFDVREKYNLLREYIFYPAQFRPHKNHVYIIDALSILKNKYSIIIDAVFTGKDYDGNLNRVLRYAESCSIKDQIHFLGFVPFEDIAGLYSNSLALVMPTYFGPANLPPLEAFALGVPVFYSDIEEFKEQLKDAPIYIDLKNPADLAEKLVGLIKGSIKKDELVKKGKEVIEGYSEDKYWNVLKEIFEDFKLKQKLWKF